LKPIIEQAGFLSKKDIEALLASGDNMGQLPCLIRCGNVRLITAMMYAPIMVQIINNETVVNDYVRDVSFDKATYDKIKAALGR